VGVVTALTAKPLHRTATTTGTVLSCDDVSGQGQENVVRYPVHGMSSTTMARANRSPYFPYGVGQTVTLQYDPIDPASATVPRPGTPGTFVAIIVVIATASVLVGTVTMVRCRKQA